MTQVTFHDATGARCSVRIGTDSQRLVWDMFWSGLGVHPEMETPYLLDLQLAFGFDHTRQPDEHNKIGTLDYRREVHVQQLRSQVLRSSDVRLAAGDETYDPFRVALNTAIALGSIPVQFLAICLGIGPAEKYGWIAPGDYRTWVGRVIREGLDRCILLDNDGWGELLTMLRRNNGSPTLATHRDDIVSAVSWEAMPQTLGGTGQRLQIRPDTIGIPKFGYSGLTAMHLRQLLFSTTSDVAA